MWVPLLIANDILHHTEAAVFSCTAEALSNQYGYGSQWVMSEFLRQLVLEQINQLCILHFPCFDRIFQGCCHVDKLIWELCLQRTPAEVFESLYQGKAFCRYVKAHGLVMNLWAVHFAQVWVLQCQSCWTLYLWKYRHDDFQQCWQLCHWHSNISKVFPFPRGQRWWNRGEHVTLYQRQMSARDVANLGKSADDGWGSN